MPNPVKDGETGGRCEHCGSEYLPEDLPDLECCEPQRQANMSRSGAGGRCTYTSANGNCRLPAGHMGIHSAVSESRSGAESRVECLTCSAHDGGHWECGCNVPGHAVPMRLAPLRVGLHKAAGHDVRPVEGQKED